MFSPTEAWRYIRAALTLNLTPRDAGFNFTNTSGDSYRTTDLSRNSIVVSCVRWIQRTISEAPPILQRWLTDQREWEDVPFPHPDVPGTRLLDVLQAPTSCYPGTTLWKATVEDLILKGNAYWVIVRNQVGAPMQLWWVPASRMTPKAERPTGLGNIDHYELSNGHDEPTRYSTDDVIHFRDGLDPSNPCLGKSGVSSLLQEILVDEQAATLTSTLMRNAGHPGAIIGPQAGSIPQEAARQIEETYNRKFSGSGAGRVMITPQPLDLKTIAFTPAQMEMRAQRAIPEERATAVIGVNAAVVGLGSGLASTKVGATLREYREEAFESTLIPLYRDLAAHLTQQLLPQFGLEEDWRLTFDLRGVRVLQEDELARVERIARLVTDGIVMVSEGRRMLGIPVAEDGSQDIYLRPANLRMIPEGPLRIQTNPIVPNRDSQVDSQELVRGMIGEALSENGHASATSAKRGVRK